MRSSFPEFYSPTPDEEKRFVKEGTVVLDTNVLLGLYSMTSVQRNMVLDVLALIGDRLWIPYQVGLEYQRRRLDTIQKQASFYLQLVDIHGIKTSDTLVKNLDAMTVPEEVKAEVRPLLGPMRDALLGAVAAYVETVADITDKHIVTTEQANENDPVRERLDALFEGHVGARPDTARHVARLQEAAKRFADDTPPGYKDGGNAGDFLLWAEVLDHAKPRSTDGPGVEP